MANRESIRLDNKGLDDFNGKFTSIRSNFGDLWTGDSATSADRNLNSIMLHIKNLKVILRHLILLWKNLINILKMMKK